MTADASGRYSAVGPPAPAVAPPPPPPPVPVWQFVLPALAVVFSSGGAWVQVANLEADVAALERRLEDHTTLGGHREGMHRIEQLERRESDARAREDASTRIFAAKLDNIMVTLADLCAAQRPNPCKR